nr:putative ribonuclease H-like domain-containing protein [Tanacetum cinerariifolium]
GTHSTNFSGTKVDASKDVKKDVSSLRYIVLPNWVMKNTWSLLQVNLKVSDALQDPSWVEAMQEELLQFKIQKVWSLVDCPKGVRPIRTKWVLKNKKDERGIVIKNKAWLVAQGHTQEEGIDYDEVFTPVARIKTIRLFLAYALFMGFTVSSNPQLCREFEAVMHEKFQMSAMGELNFFLGLCQIFKYPHGQGESLGKGWHQVTPKEYHLHAVKMIFRYLKGHPKLGLWYPKDSHFDLVAYSDSDYGGATQDRKSTSRGCQFLGRRLISWQCKKQIIVATSTTVAEYVAAASCYLLTKPFDAGRFQYLV